MFEKRKDILGIASLWNYCNGNIVRILNGLKCSMSEGSDLINWLMNRAEHCLSRRERKCRRKCQAKPALWMVSQEDDVLTKNKEQGTGQLCCHVNQNTMFSWQPEHNVLKSTRTQCSHVNKEHNVLMSIRTQCFHVTQNTMFSCHPEHNVSHVTQNTMFSCQPEHNVLMTTRTQCSYVNKEHNVLMSIRTQCSHVNQNTMFSCHSEHNVLMTSH